MIEPQKFRDALGRFATGVTVVTMDQPGGPRGITVNAFLSLSLTPPLVGIAIDRSAGAHGTLLEVPDFGVSVLAASQRELSDRYAGRTTAAEATFGRLGSVPVIEGAIAQLACRIAQRLPVGDHTLFVGEVEEAVTGAGTPLLYYQGRYGVDGDP